MANYHEILGVQRGADKDAIKKAFRKKAKQMHPDANPNDKGAHLKFIELCEAYDALLNGKEPQDPIFTGRKYNRKFTKEEFEEHLKKAKEFAKRKAVQEEEQLKIDYQNLLKSFTYKASHYVAIISIFMGSLLILDYSITYNESKALVIKRKVSNPIYLTVEHLEADKTTDLSVPIQFNYAFLGEVITLRTSRIFNEVVEVSGARREDGVVRTFSNRNTVYSAFYALMLILFFPIVTYAVKGPNPAFYFFLHINTYVPAITVTVISFLIYST
jgi:curved DNA-binding protein CbpA